MSRSPQRLLAAGADVTAPSAPRSDGQGHRTALSYAAEAGHLDMVKLLLDNYPLEEDDDDDDESLATIRGDAAEVARKRYHWQVVDLIENHRRERHELGLLPSDRKSRHSSNDASYR